MNMVKRTNRKGWLLAGSALVAAASAWVSLATVEASGEGSAPLEIGTGRQLFFDRRFIAESENVRIAMNSPAKAGIVLSPDQSWEAFRLTSYFTVVQDGDICRMYYSCFSKDQWHTPDSWNKHAYLCYAESEDGIHWKKPNLGIVDFEGSKDNNIILRSVVDGTVFIDPRAPPERRYKLLSTVGPHSGGLRISYSADGVRFTMGQPVSPWNPDSQQNAFWDRRLKKYTAFLRKNTDLGRAVGRIELQDIEAPWQGDLKIVFIRDERDPADVDFYTNACVQYPWAEDAYFMFPAAYHHFPPQMGNDGLLDTSVAASRDGIHWVRPDRGPYVPLGESNAWDARFVMLGVGMVRRGDEIYQYYNGIHLSHGGTRGKSPEQRAKLVQWGSMGRVVQRLDGFYSADAAYEGGWLLTPPVIFQGDRLVLNVNTSAAGSAYVAITDTEGRSLEGFTIADCDKILTNDVDHVVTWKGKSNVSALAGKPVRLRFEMRSTKLYAFQFQPAAK